MTESRVDTAAKLLALRSVSGLGDSRIVWLLDSFGSIDAVLEAPAESFDDVSFIDQKTYRAIGNLDEMITELQTRIEGVLDAGIQVIPYANEQYPASLRETNAPVVLFAQGDYSLLDSASVSFAGSREANQKALTWTKTVSAELVQEDYVIVSGGALGVDTAAHEAALEAGGKTIAVLAGGPNHRYPEANEELFDQIQSEGLLLWQQPPGQSPSRFDFLDRNKTNSGMSQAIVIGAAGSSGGTMSQYEDAKKQGTDVFIPLSDLGHEPAEGLNEMEAEDVVTTVKSADGIVEHLSRSAGQTTLKDWDE